MASPGLINLQTDLTSLRYGSDKPYVTKDIGQAPSTQVGRQIQSRIDDTSRIAQMLIDKPGLKFIANQALLQQVDIQDKLQKNRDGGNKTLAGAIIKQGLETVKQTAKILGSTLAQVPVNGTGTHFVYAFRTDTYLQPSGENSRSAFAQFFGAGGVEGAPLALKGKPIEGVVESNFGEPNQQTGEFKITVESELDYDEKINTLLPGRSEYTNAKEGTSIIEDNLGQEGWKPYTSTGVKEQFVNRDTNKITSQSIFVSKEIQDKKRSATTGSVRNSPIEIISPLTGTPLTIPQKETTLTARSLGVSNQNTVGTVTGGDITVKPFTQEDQESIKKGKNSTEQNIINVLTGSAIPLKREEGSRDTTATSRSFGRSNKDVEGDVTPLEQPKIAPFKEDENTRKSKLDTVSNIRNTLIGSAVPLKDSSRETTAGIQGSISNKGVPFDIPENSTNNVGETIYSSGNTYTGTSTQDAINAAVGGTTIHTNKLSGSYRPSDPNPATNTQASYQPFDNPVRISEISEKDQTKGPATGGVYDFRKEQGKAYSFDYNSNNVNREQRVNLGNQGKVSFDRSNYGNSSDTDTHDTLNKLNESATRIDGTADARDLAKLYFEIITPDGSTFLHFRAFIDSIDDSYNADWQGFKYVGRAENFYTYGGFDRDINISFKIAAATRAEMKPLYRKMVYLASSTAPTYGGQGFMRGTLARMTIGSYIAQIPGVITSVKYSLIQDMPWEISMQNPEAGTDDDIQELPMGLQCSVSFKAIHDFAPQTGLQHYFTSPEPLNGSKSFLI